MPITVLSPYSGRAIKARDQDVGRALRDEEGRIFYVVERPDGSGYYAAPTRKGSDKDLQRYDALHDKGETARQTHHDRSAEQVAAHDARGRGRRASPIRLALLLLLIALLAVGGYVGITQSGLLDEDAPTPDVVPDGLPVLPDTPSLPIDHPVDLGADAGPAMPNGSARATQAAAGGQTRGLAGPGYVTAWPGGPAEALEEGWVERASGLRYKVIEPGFGERARAGSFVTVAYEVRLATGTAIDSSRADGPLRFVLWSGQAMRAWDEAVTGMQAGERREVVIPPSLIDADGESMWPGGVANLRLRATVELLSVRQGVAIEMVDAGQAGRRVVMPGDRVELDYAARVGGADEAFATSAMLGEPLRFVVGGGEVVPGLDLGVAGMAIGERRRVTIPPYLAYGRRGFAGLIPPDATLVYDLTLRRVIDE
jgi:FKBP-type peptidyl-prolyl cis-trans isomerase